MWLYVCKALVITCLLAGNGCLFWYLGKGHFLGRRLREAYDTLDNAGMERARTHRKELALLKERDGLLGRMESRLVYSGLPGRFPFLTIEIWLLSQLGAGLAVYAACVLLGAGWKPGLGAAATVVAVCNLAEGILGRRNYRAVNDDLMPFINLLGNYSITAGEVTGVFGQIGRYLKAPLGGALEECYYEAQTSGDSSVALLALADKIEHPKFKEIIRNTEVCARYSTDFSLLVSRSRKEVQDYMRARQERRAMANESMVNMFLLYVLLAVTLVIVDQLVGQSVWAVLAETTAGHAALLVTGLMTGLYLWELSGTGR